MNDFVAWTGEPTDLSLALTGLHASRSYSVEGQTFRIPTREDYERALRESRAIGPNAHIVEHPQLAAAAQAHWHASGSNGCVFAAALSASRVDSGWETYVLQGPVVDAAVAAHAIDVLCRPRVAAPEAEVVSVLMPTADDADTIARLLSCLGALEHWDVCERGVEDVQGIGNVVLLGVRAEVELGHWAEVLGFGTFAGQGNTRIAPFTELAIRVKEPPRPRRDHRAYMAHIPMDLDKVEFGGWWHDTEQQRAARLGAAQDARAKGRVTFALEQGAWERIEGMRNE